MGARSLIAVGGVVSLALFAGTMAHGQQPLPGPVYAPVPGPVYAPPPAPVAVPAEVRVIEQDLLVSDPTVAARQRGLVGVGVEGWFVTLPNWPYWDVLSNTVKETTTYFGNVGGNITVGYDDFWALVSYRIGKGTEKRPFSSGVTHVDSHVDRTQSEAEVKFRYLFRDINLGTKEMPMSPYVLAGYSYFRVGEDHKLDTANWIWTRTGTPNKLRTTTYQSGFIGGGFLAAFTPNFGIRNDLTFATVYADQTDDNELPKYGTSAVSAWGTGLNYHLTAYYKITDSLVAQAGMKMTVISTSSLDINLFAAVGGYVNLAYIHRF